MTVTDEKALVIGGLIIVGVGFAILIYLILFEYLNPWGGLILMSITSKLFGTLLLLLIAISCRAQTVWFDDR